MAHVPPFVGYRRTIYVTRNKGNAGKHEWRQHEKTSVMRLLKTTECFNGEMNAYNDLYQRDYGQCFRMLTVMEFIRVNRNTHRPSH